MREPEEDNAHPAQCRFVLAHIRTLPGAKIAMA